MAVIDDLSRGTGWLR